MNVPDRVEVEWLDSQGDSRWQTLADARYEAEGDDLLHRSIGYVLADEERYLLLAASYREEREGHSAMVADVMQLPRSAVVSVTPLKLDRRKP